MTIPRSSPRSPFAALDLAADQADDEDRREREETYCLDCDGVGIHKGIDGCDGAGCDECEDGACPVCEGSTVDPDAA